MNLKLRKFNVKRGTNRACLFGAVACAISFSALAAGTHATKDNNSLPSFDSLNIISTRNIFDPDRPHIPAPTPPAVSDSFELVGTMNYSKGKFAFFDSARPEYKTVLEPGATIAGYTIKDVTAKSITLLAANGSEIAMTIGTKMLGKTAK